MLLRAALCGLLSLVLSASAISGTINSDMPPERFRGDAIAIVVFTTQEGIEKACGKAQPGFVMIACHRQTHSGASVLFMPNPCIIGDIEAYARIACHEKAHALGWTAEHEL